MSLFGSEEGFQHILEEEGRVPRTPRSKRVRWLGQYAEEEGGFDHVRIHLALLADERLKPLDQVVYMALVTWANIQTGLAWPSEKKIAERAGVSVSTVQRALARLRDTQWIQVVDRRPDVNHYTLLPPPWEAVCAWKEQGITSDRHVQGVPQAG